MNLRKLQNDSKRTIEENAMLLNLPRSTYNNYLCGYREPNIKLLKDMADFFDVSLDYLCNRKWKNNVGYIPEDRREVIQKILELSDANFGQIQDYVNFISSK